MSHSVRVSPRSFLIAGMSAAVVGAAAVTPVSAPAPSPAKISAAVELTSLASGLGGVIDNLSTVSNGIQGAFNNLTGAIGGTYDNVTVGIENTINSVTATINYVASLPDGVQAAMKNTYDSLALWPRYVSDWTQFSLGLIPGLWYIPPSIAFAYNTAEPLARAGAYSSADLVGLDFAQFARDINEGVRTSAENAATYGKAWADSFVAVPTLPAYPGPWPGANIATALPAASTATAAAPRAAAVTGGVESAIKDTYNAVEPWVAWGFQLTQWGLGFVPGLWWVAPGISLGYYSIEPLVQAGVYTFADVLGLDFAQIGPDIQQGVQQSAQNFVDYSLAWVQSLIPFPPLPPLPPRPGAAVAGPAASTVRAAAALQETEAIASATAAEVTPVANSATATGNNSPAEDTTPVAEAAAPVAETVTPVAEAAAPVAETVTPAVTAPQTEVLEVQTPAIEAPATAVEAAQPVRAPRGGHRAPATEVTAPKAGAAAESGDNAGAGNSVKAQRPGRSSR